MKLTADNAIRALTLVAIVSIAAAIAGCHKPSYAGGIASPSWSNRQPGETPIPGLDVASATCGLWPAGGMAVVVWTDLAYSSASSPAPAETDAKGAVFEGHHRGPGDRKVDCRCETSDGHTGVVTINGQAFELAQGSFFLVSTARAEAQIRQLKRDTAKLTPDDLKPLAKTDHEIIDFYTEIAREK